MLLPLLLFGLLVLFPTQITGVDNTSLEKKILFGYQGWFDTPASGSTRGSWVHWAPGSSPTWNGSSFDLWPYMDEYEGE
jgi:hypothetical protein